MPVPEVLLMIDRSRRQVLAVAEPAFTRAQATAEELRDYLGVMILNRSGQLRIIQRIDIVAAFGQSPARKLWSRLTSAWQISVGFSHPVNADLHEMKTLIIECIAERGGFHGPGVDEVMTRDHLMESVRGALSFQELFEALRMPSAEDALDVL